jgi:hypothetical protein
MNTMKNGLWNLFFAWDPDENNNREKYEKINYNILYGSLFFSFNKIKFRLRINISIVSVAINISIRREKSILTKIRNY